MNQFTIIPILVIIIFIINKIWKTSPTKSTQSQIHLCESPIEKRLYLALRHNGHYPVPQVKCGPYRIDLTIPYTSPPIAIECDGHKYHSTKQQIARDRAKDDYLRQHGYIVARFRGWQINKSMGYVLDRIENTVTSLHKQNMVE